MDCDNQPTTLAKIATVFVGRRTDPHTPLEKGSYENWSDLSQGYGLLILLLLLLLLLLYYYFYFYYYY